ncbi:MULTISPECIES: stressosome-associated protein Prli42 [unclassified Rummeliibacillus]|nr:MULTISPECIES: stressosome-associated protein Prli42 [unclassified Rummeliibacillus]
MFKEKKERTRMSNKKIQKIVVILMAAIMVLSMLTFGLAMIN